MAKVFIEETTLTAIGDAIREKEGSSELVPVTDMASRITSLPSGGGDIEVEPIVLTGDCSYAGAGLIPVAYIKLFGDTITTKDITNAAYMFQKVQIEELPFDINISDAYQLNNTFYFCDKLAVCPKIRGTIKWNTSTTFQSMLYKTLKLRDIEDLFTPEMLDGFSTIKVTSAYTCPKPIKLEEMRSLRQVPTWWYKFKPNEESTVNPSSSYHLYYNGFSHCESIDEILDIPVWPALTTSNLFNSTVSACYRLKNITFETNADGTPKTAQWKSQTIDFSNSSIGYAPSAYAYDLKTSLNAGISEDKLVETDEQYHALKNDPDWFTTYSKYSRYNHDSAVATINSLPDTSAYLAANGGTNTIKFKGAVGSSTDGGAVNTLTEEEIAVATAKGWTVTLS